MDTYYTEGDVHPGPNGYVQIPVLPGHYDYFQSPPYSAFPFPPALPFPPGYPYISHPRMEMLCPDQWAGDLGCSMMPYPMDEWKTQKFRKPPRRPSKMLASPSAAFNLFHQENYQNILQMHPHLCRNDVSAVLQQTWQELPEQEKLPYYCRTGIVPQQQAPPPPPPPPQPTTFLGVALVNNKCQPEHQAPSYFPVVEELSPWQELPLVEKIPVAENKDAFDPDTLAPVPDDLLAQALSESGIGEDDCFNDMPLSPITPPAVDATFCNEQTQEGPSQPADNEPGSDTNVSYGAAPQHDPCYPFLAVTAAQSVPAATTTTITTASSSTTEGPSHPPRPEENVAQQLEEQDALQSQRLNDLEKLLFDDQKDVLSSACELSTMFQEEYASPSEVDWAVDTFDQPPKADDPYYT